MVERTYKSVWYKSRHEFVTSTTEMKSLMDEAIKGNDNSIREVVRRARVKFSYSEKTPDIQIFDSMKKAYTSNQWQRNI